MEKKHFSSCAWMSAHLSEPKKVMGDGGGAALNLYQRDLVFSCHQNVVFVVEHSGHVHTPDENDASHTKNNTVEESLCRWRKRSLSAKYHVLCFHPPLKQLSSLRSSALFSITVSTNMAGLVFGLAAVTLHSYDHHITFNLIVPPKASRHSRAGRRDGALTSAADEQTWWLTGKAVWCLETQTNAYWRSGA